MKSKKKKKKKTGVESFFQTEELSEKKLRICFCFRPLLLMFFFYVFCLFVCLFVLCYFVLFCFGFWVLFFVYGFFFYNHSFLSVDRYSWVSKLLLKDFNIK